MNIPLWIKHRRRWILFKARWLPWTYAYRYRKTKHGGPFGKFPW
jgi:hypothetical protein